MSTSSLHIGIFGRVNTGKSSLINMLTGQDIAVASRFPGTATEPVKKSVEIPDIGRVVLVDTAGIDDLGEIGSMKIKRSREVIKRVDCAILLISGNQFGDYEVRLIDQFKKNEVPHVIAHNKSDIDKIAAITETAIKQYTKAQIIDFSIIKPNDIKRLTNALRRVIPETAFQEKSLIGDLIQPKEVILLITNGSSEATEGRMISPLEHTLRDALDHQCIIMVIKERELSAFSRLRVRPALAITDSSAFGSVAKKLPEEIPLTSFSILFARLKTDFEKLLEGTLQITKLQDDDSVLILENCAHQVSCDDTDRVKLPMLLQKYTGKKLHFTVVPGFSELPSNVSDYSLVIQCGGCMITRKQLLNRIHPFTEAGVAVTNYGMVHAYLQGVFGRATHIFNKNRSDLQLFPNE